jgi:hypothetical protein
MKDALQGLLTAWVILCALAAFVLLMNVQLTPAAIAIGAMFLAAPFLPLLR